MASFRSYIRDVRRHLEERKGLALEKIGLLVEGEAKLRAPVDSGTLKGSITHDVDKNTVRIGTNLEYAGYVEKGTSKMRAQPYLTPALEDNIEEIKDIVREVYEND